MNNIKLLFLIGIFSLGGVVGLYIPSYLESCRLDDTAFSSCAINSGKKLLSAIHNGDKKLGIPDITPLVIPFVEVKSGSTFNINFTDLNVYGLDTLIPKNISISKNKIQIDFTFDTLQLVGPYSIFGRILILALNGSGAANVTIWNVDGKYVAELLPFERNKKSFSKIGSDDLEFTIQKAFINLDNLVPSSQQLSEDFNKVLNDNWEAVLQDLRPAIEITVNSVIRSVIGNLFSKIPFNKLFLQ